MKVLLDTNVLVAAFVARGTCSELLEHCARVHELIGSDPLLRELEAALTRKLGFPSREARAARRLVASRVRLVEPARLPAPVCRDPDDDLVLATALAGRCACIVTGDADLLVLGAWHGIAILRPADFWAFETV